MIRAARAADSKSVIPLMHTAIDNIANKLSGYDDVKRMYEALTSFFESEGNRLSYTNTIVKEVDGNVVGFVLSYDGSKQDELDQPIIDHLIKVTGNKDVYLEKETREDEYYLDSLAVDDRYQGQGIGKALMKAFEVRAADEGHDKVALIVEKENHGAHALYEKMGYCADGKLMVCEHEYTHMVKMV
ncbi:GNAT family N-acetyltransferase [Paenibacillus sp. KN14-4R]|uniref:GNAT family N-acetyltransferase n=1 Tax=Paenibacillus sp. KN14-4R TaxID=3445773 RepID=UPI003FA0BF9E